jgi:hypothetical protein
LQAYVIPKESKMIPKDSIMDATNKGGVSKLVKAWEAKNNERTKRLAGLGLMAVSLAACGSDDTDGDGITNGDAMTSGAGP